MVVYNIRARESIMQYDNTVTILIDEAWFSLVRAAIAAV